MQERIFENRRAAGLALAEAFGGLKLEPPLIVLGLPRGGVPVAVEVARALAAPLDVLVVRKVGAPGQPELAIGAVASGGVQVQDDAFAPGSMPFPVTFRQLAEPALAELRRRERVYRAGAGPLHLDRKTVVIVDDGLATGSTMLAAVRAARKAGAKRIIVAAPVASTEATRRLAPEADSMVILSVPRSLTSVGEWYEDFEQVDDAEVLALLGRSMSPSAGDA